MCVCVYVCKWVHVCVYICVYVYVCMCVYEYLLRFPNWEVPFSYVRVCVCVVCVCCIYPILHPYIHLPDQTPYSYRHPSAYIYTHIHPNPYISPCSEEIPPPHRVPISNSYGYLRGPLNPNNSPVVTRRGGRCVYVYLCLCVYVPA